MRFGFLTSAGFLIFIHDPSGSAARGVLKGFILAESQPIGGFHQAGIGALDDFPSVVVRQTQHLCNQRGHHLRIPGAGSGGAAAGGFLPSAALAQIAGAPVARAAGLSVEFLSSLSRPQ